MYRSRVHQQCSRPQKAGSGGGIFSRGLLTLTDDGGPKTFCHNTAALGYGGAVHVDGGTASFAGVDFNGATNTSGNSAKYGGSVSVGEEATAEFQGVTFALGSADLGGALYNAGIADLKTGTKFGTTAVNGNTANSGGAVYSTGTTNLAGVVAFSYNFAENGGGAMTLNSGRLKSEAGGDYTFRSNSTDGSGGALNFAESANAELSGTFGFEDNEAELSGGAIYTAGQAIDAGSAEILFLRNKANGGINENTSDASSSYSLQGLGGAVYYAGSGESTFGHTEFSSNSAPLGGALYVVDGEMIFSGDVIFTRNSAYTGGAVYTTDTAYNSSGNPYTAGGTLTFENTANFSNNTAQDDGGALYAIGDTTNIKFNASVTFRNNTANNDAGDYGSGGAAWLGCASSPFVGSVSFINNKVLGSSSTNAGDKAGDGGALYIAFEEPFEISAETGYIFEGNQAYRHGGAIYSETTDITIRNAAISGDNRALHGNGGFIWSGGEHTVTITRTIVTSPRPTQTKAMNGGIVFIDSGGTLIVGSAAKNDSGDVEPVIFSNIKVDESGGAIYMKDNCTLTMTNAIIQDNRADEDGGAVYMEKPGNAIFANILFSGNQADGGGGAIYVNEANVTITNSIFRNNESHGAVQGHKNGGAIHFAGACSSGIEQSTFISNRCTAAGLGGAVFAQGELSIGASYFYQNIVQSEGMGGAVYMYQQGAGNGRFLARASMFDSNSATANGTGDAAGGGLFLRVDVANVEKCTFTKNTVEGASSVVGGALYMNTAGATASTLENSTFTENTAVGGTASGGAAALSTSAMGITIRSCTITKDNRVRGSDTAIRGGGIYFNSGTFTIMGTLIVGNIAADGRGPDVWFNEGVLVTSRGYNRVGIVGQGSGRASWRELATLVLPDADREDNNDRWTTEAFFRNGDLASNDKSVLGVDLGVSLIGAEFDDGLNDFDGSTRIYLRTLLLSEDFSVLELADGATGVIPQLWAKSNLPDQDQRNQRRGEIINDIGAVLVSFITIADNPEEPGDVISRVLISGIPNSIRSVGQTASLIAMVFYTNGKTNYGGPASAGFEPVYWSTSASSVLSIDQSGNIVALRTTYTPDYATPGTVTVMVSTQRLAANGKPATDARAVRITNDYANLNVSPAYRNELSDYVQNIFEYDLSLMLSDASTSTVNASSFQRNFKAVWAAEDVSQVTDLKTNAPVFSTNYAYAANDGYKAAKAAGVKINFSSLNDGNLFPLTYSWNFSGEEIKSILGYDLTSASISNSLAEELFKHLRIDFEGSSRNWVVIGNGGVSASDARGAGALTLTESDSGRGVRIELTAYLANVAATGAGDGAQLVRGGGGEDLLVVPDGLNDGAISGTMWMAVKSSSMNTTPSTPANPDTPTPIITDNNTGTSGSESSGGGGGGCSSLGVGIFGAVLLLVLKRTKK